MEEMVFTYIAAEADTEFVFNPGIAKDEREETVNLTNRNT